MSSVLLRIDNSVATITLNRPEALNAFNDSMASDWARACTSAVSDETVKAIVVEGEGRAFCAGGDVKAMYAMANRGPSITALAREINVGLRALTDAAIPVLAVAHGTTAGGGLGVLLSTDYAIAGESSKIGSLYAGVGLTPDLSVSTHLARAIGERRALQLTLSHRLLSAEEALDWGLIAEVVPDGDIAERAREIAADWVAAAPAYGQAKRLIRAGTRRSFSEQLEDEADTIGRAAMTPLAEARMGAFAAR